LFNARLISKGTRLPIRRDVRLDGLQEWAEDTTVTSPPRFRRIRLSEDPVSSLVRAIRGRGRWSKQKQHLHKFRVPGTTDAGHRLYMRMYRYSRPRGVCSVSFTMIAQTACSRYPSIRLANEFHHPQQVQFQRDNRLPQRQMPALLDRCFAHPNPPYPTVNDKLVELCRLCHPREHLLKGHLAKRPQDLENKIQRKARASSLLSSRDCSVLISSRLLLLSACRLHSRRTVVRHRLTFLAKLFSP
jgi:hypothetical protein